MLSDERVCEACKTEEKVSKVTSVLLLVEKVPSIARIEYHARAKLGPASLIPTGRTRQKTTQQYSQRLLNQSGAKVSLGSGSFGMLPGPWGSFQRLGYKSFRECIGLLPFLDPATDAVGCSLQAMTAGSLPDKALEETS